MYVVITGASSGIGKELAFIYAREGYDLVLIARRMAILEDIKAAIRNDFPNLKVIVFPADLGEIKNCDELFDVISALDIAIFINNAGFGQIGLYNEMDLSREMEMIDLNIRTILYLTRKYIQMFSEGIIVNISSLAAFLPTPRMASYAATKSFVYSFSQATNYELKKSKSKIRVLTVAPGPVETEFAKVANSNHKMKGMSANKCAKKIYSGIKKRKKLIIPGFSMKLIYFVLRFVPTSVVLNMSYKIQNRK